MSDVVVPLTRYRYPSEETTSRKAHDMAIKALTDSDTFGAVARIRLRHEFSASFSGTCSQVPSGTRATVNLDFDLDRLAIRQTLGVIDANGAVDESARNYLLELFAAAESGSFVGAIVTAWHELFRASGANKLLYSSWYYDIPDPDHQGWINFP